MESTTLAERGMLTGYSDLLSFDYGQLTIDDAAFLLTPPPLGAQDLPLGVPPGQTVLADPEPEDRKLSLESVAPYSSWKHHVAERPELAIVQVRFSETANAPGGTAAGLVIRCDGFVLIPRAVRDAARNKGRVDVTFPGVNGVPGGADGDGQNGKRPPVTAPARYHIGTTVSVPYDY